MYFFIIICYPLQRKGYCGHTKPPKRPYKNNFYDSFQAIVYLFYLFKIEKKS